MDRILFGDNQFFAINPISEEKSRLQSIKFRDDEAIMNVLNAAIDAGIHTFMCTTHGRISNICNFIRRDPQKYRGFKIYPCMPYAHKYANAVTELGLLRTMKEYFHGNMVNTFFKGGMAYVFKDYISMMELMIDAEMSMFKGIETPIIFLQNAITDLLLGMGMVDILKAFYTYVVKKYNIEAGFVSMNMPKLLTSLERSGINYPIICTAINKIGFRMAGGTAAYERALRSQKARIIAMQVLAAGAIKPSMAVEYVCRLKNIESILFGASTESNIQETTSLIRKYDALYQVQETL